VVGYIGENMVLEQKLAKDQKHLVVPAIVVLDSMSRTAGTRERMF
jgi:hypothetical protein